MDRDHLETFATVAETRNFERAAAALSITRGAVSQRIKALEQALATVLLVRSQPVVPTPAGEVLLRHVKALRLLEAQTLRELATDARPTAPVPVAIALNPDSLATWFPKAVWPLLLERRISLEVIVDDEDYTDERLRRGEVVGCVSTEPTAAAGFVAEAIGAMEYRCYASPAFLQEFFPAGLSVAAAMFAPAILFDRKDALHDAYLARCFGFALERYPQHRLPAPTTLLDAIAAGIGYGLAPSEQAARLVAEGAIVELPPCEALQVELYWHHWASEPALAQEITRCVVESARGELHSAPLNASHSF
jgi:LysR family transcriptional regulator (chromosome initiation inhibitor)